MANKCSLINTSYTPTIYTGHGRQRSSLASKLCNMHRCLLVPELIHLICEEASNLSRNRDRNLLSLALTCRSFQEPSLDRLWYSLETIDPLIRCMPSDLWTTEGRVLEGKRFLDSIIFRRPIVPDDWTRFEIHARRVRHLGGVIIGRRHRRRYLTHDTYQTLELSDHPKLLLPNLIRLNWPENHHKIFPFVKLFLGPQLRELYIYLGDPLTRISLFPTLCTQCPFLTYLDITPTYQGSTGALEWAQAISPALQSLKHLRELSVGEIDLEAFIYLAELPHLQYLRCVTNTIKSPAALRPTSALPTFPSLQELYIHIACASLATSLINSMSCQALKRIHIFSINSSPSSLNSFTKILAGKCSREILESVIVRGGDYFDGEIRCSPSMDVTPLLAYSELTNLDIRDSDIDDKAMLTLALAWPKITSLCLLASTTDGLRRTLQSITYLAKHCRILKRLFISVDARHVPTTDASSESLTTLKFCNSPISDPKGVADFLMKTFPSLRFFGGLHGGAEELWDEVDNRLSSFMDTHIVQDMDSDSEDGNSE